MAQICRKIDCGYISKLEPTRFTEEIHVGSKIKIRVKNDCKFYGLSKRKEETQKFIELGLNM